ncbi:FG-GAP repeat domain-containing protein [Arsenicicoccus dermatophilus]|uniref:FG-GAP repeat domain-containing protein n=1 Tax=Arsenicicoccus dermatophilus TaxID=1076331 RepID=UPI001F4C897C|nr:VCBS repeat-containing protein [Arsenicicoccus dermatophilus]MCH8612299.1 hypothetical protein [Arsenicicoccus dermatophilus]
MPAHPTPRPGRVAPLAIGAVAVTLGLAAVGSPAQAAGKGPDRLAIATADLTTPRTARPAAGARAALDARTRDTAPRVAGAARRAATTAKGRPSSVGTTQGVPAGCAPLGLQADQLRDRTWILWSTTDASGAPVVSGTATVSRLREGSTTWQTVGTVPATAGAILDGTQSPAGPASYRITTTVNGTALTCEMADAAGEPVTGLSMFPDAGPGVPDFASATTATASLQLQNDSSLAMPLEPSSSLPDTVTPAFSPDGQWLAYSRWTDGSRTGADLVLQRADGRGTPSLLRGAAADAAAPVNLEPSFSPDGRWLSWVRYAPDTAGRYVPRDIQIRDNATGTVRTLSKAYGAATWDRDSATLVAADVLTPTGGLVTIDVTSGAVTALSGTAGGYDPTVTRTGQIVFAFDTGTARGLRTRTTTTATGTVSTRYSAGAGASLSNPRVTRDGSAVYFRMDLDPDTTPSSGDETTGVYRLVGSSAFPDITAVGGTAADQASVAVSFDLRMAPGKGTSDLNGDGANDLVGKDASGNLWLYANTRVDSAPLRTRTQIGVGWNVFNLVLTPGDLTDDGIGDILGRDAYGNLFLYPGSGAGTVRGKVQVGKGWTGYTIVSVGDWDRDTHADLVARDSAGALWLYRGSGRTHVPNVLFGSRVQIGTGWSGLNAIVGVGDANYDNKADLLGRVASTGRLVSYFGPGDASRNYGASTTNTTSSFASFSQIVGAERYSGYGTSLVMVDSAGNMQDVLFTGDGQLAYPYSTQQIATGGSAFRWAP